MWNMLVKIPEHFVHLDVSYMYQSMDLTNDKPSDCKMRAILKDFKRELFPHFPYSLDLAPCDYHLFPALKDHLGASASYRKLNSMQKFRCSSRKWTHRSTISELKNWSRVITNASIYFVNMSKNIFNLPIIFFFWIFWNFFECFVRPTHVIVELPS